MDRTPEPHELAEAHFAELDERRARMVAEATCGDCGRCERAPKWLTEDPVAMCWFHGDFVSADQRVKDYCDFFEER